MHFHFCGDIFHDVTHNLFVLIALLPEWVPFLGHLKARHDCRHTHE